MAKAAAHLSNDEFFTKLAALFAARQGKDHGSVYMTQKRVTNDSDPEKGYLLLRATNGKSKRDRSSKIKLSTVIEDEAEIAKFYAKYAEVCKAGMTDLKKRERKKDKNKKKKAATKGAV